MSNYMLMRLFKISAKQLMVINLVFKIISFIIKKIFELFQKNNCVFYIIHMFDESEAFIKAGLTKNNVKQRYSQLEQYDYQIISTFKTTPAKAKKLEKYLEKNFPSYNPENKFAGYTECFPIDKQADILTFVQKKL